MKPYLFHKLIIGTLLLLCAACAVEVNRLTINESTSSATVVSIFPTVQPTVLPEDDQSTSLAVPQHETPSLQPLATATAELAPSPTVGNTPLPGTLALLVSESPRSLETHASIFDLGTGTFRDLDIQQDRVTAMQWLGNGCELYLNGEVYDLNGSVIWQAPMPVKTRLGSLYRARLSLQKNWLSYPVFSGTETYDSNEFVDVETVSLRPPYLAYRLTQRGGAEVESFVWSPDERWVYFSDYDVNGILQIFRATPDGQSREQLTHHEEGLGRVNAMAISPNGQRLAYGIDKILATSSPYEYDAADEGWVGMIDLETGSMTQIRLPKFDSAFNEAGLWWNATGSELLMFGSSLPIAPTDPLHGKQAHWVRVDEGGNPHRSLYESEVPGNSIGWMMPVSTLETLFLQTRDGYYLFQNGVFSPYDAFALLDNTETQGRIIAFIPGPIEFPGESACQE